MRDPQERELYRTRWNEACREAREGNGYIRAMECVITHRGGHSRSLEMAGVILGDDEDNYLITLVDVSQRKAVEERARYLALLIRSRSCPIDVCCLTVFSRRLP